MNVEKLLSQAPLKGRVVLGFDPGYYNGCKLAVLDETGKMLTVDKIYPFRKDGEIEKSKKKLLDLINKYKVKIVAIGNGTASRESEKLVAELGKPAKKKPAKKLKNPDTAHVEEELKVILGTKVNIVEKGKKGKIEIECYSRDELNRLIELLKKLG